MEFTKILRCALLVSYGFYGSLLFTTISINIFYHCELCQYLQYARLSLKFRIHWSEKIVLLQYKKYFDIRKLRYSSFT